jgi:hypothetical protein
MSDSVLRIPSRYLKTLQLRGALTWLFARLSGMAMIAAAKDAGFPVDWEPLGPLWTVAASASLVLIDLHRRHEIRLLHNIGVTTRSAVAVACLPSVLFESLVFASSR